MEPSPVLSPARVTEIPGLDPEPRYTPLAGRSAGGLPRITLPSGHAAVHLTRYADVHRALTDPAFGRTAANAEGGPSFLPTPLPPELLITLDAPHHARMRSMVTADYSTAGVEKLRPVVEKVIDERFAALRSAERPDLFRTVLEPFTTAVNCHFLGISAAEYATVRPCARTVQMGLADDIPALVEDFTTVYGYLTDLVTGARPTRPDGFVARLAAGRDRAEPPLSDAELVGLLIGSVVAGDQNALSGITKVVYALLSAPALWQRLVAEPAVAPRLAEELFRLIPLGAVSIFPRIATREVVMSGGAVHAGDIVYADALAANRDAAVFPDPEAIDPDRGGKRHLQFGYGMHHCMGAALTRLELTTLLTRLAGEFPGLALAADPGTLPWDDGVLLRRPAALPVRW